MAGKFSKFSSGLIIESVVVIDIELDNYFLVKKWCKNEPLEPSMKRNNHNYLFLDLLEPMNYEPVINIVVKHELL